MKYKYKSNAERKEQNMPYKTTGDYKRGIYLAYKASLIFLVISILAFGAGQAFATDIEGIGGIGGSAVLNGVYTDQLDGTWIHESGNYFICDYSGTYAMVTEYPGTCGSEFYQLHYNFGAAYTEDDIVALVPGDWTNSNFGGTPPDFDLVAGGGGGGGATTTEATSTIEQMQTNLFYGYILMFIAAFFGIFALAGNRK